MLTLREKNARNNRSIKLGSKSFEIAVKFKYSRTNLINKNLFNEEITSGCNYGICFYYLAQNTCILSSRLSSMYRMRVYYRSILQNHIFTNTEQKYMMLLPFERVMFAVSLVSTTSYLPSGRALNCHKLLHRANYRTHELRSVGEVAISLQH
jgi:hypothetical protein